MVNEKYDEFTTKDIINLIHELNQKMDERFQRMDERFQKMDSKIEDRFQRLEDKLETRFDRIDNKFIRIDDRLLKTDERINKIEAEMAPMAQQVRTIYRVSFAAGIIMVGALIKFSLKILGVT